MALDLADYERKAREATMAFWGNRAKAIEAKLKVGTVDQGERGAVTAGTTMDGFAAMMIDLVHANGLGHAQIHRTKGVLTLPGYFRPTKLWDILVIHQGRLIAALEMKSQVGSFGNNANNRAEEAIGTAHDFWTAYREGAFGADAVRPFVGWLTMVEDAPASRRPAIRESSRHYPIFPEFRGASVLQRYDLLCQRLMRESLYTAACTLASPREAKDTGVYAEMSELTGLRAFVSTFAGHIAAEAARQ